MASISTPDEILKFRNEQNFNVQAKPANMLCGIATLGGKHSLIGQSEVFPVHTCI